MSFPELKLYKYDSCYFCRLVMDSVSNLNIKVTYLDIQSNPENYKKLLSDTGRATVPCLYINGNPMHESYDIIQWLNQNVDKLEKN